MAKIMVNFDTSTKEFSVAMDKQPIENVIYVSFMPKYMGDGMYGDMSCSIQTKDENEDEGTCEYKFLTATAAEYKIPENFSEAAKKFLESFK